MRRAWQPDADVTATDDMFRAECTATLQRLAADTYATAPVALANTLMRSLRSDNPPMDDDGLQYRLSLPDTPYSANDAHGRHQPPSAATTTAHAPGPANIDIYHPSGPTPFDAAVESLLADPV
jgi:hypothetical protein